MVCWSFDSISYMIGGIFGLFIGISIMYILLHPIWREKDEN